MEFVRLIRSKDFGGFKDFVEYLYKELNFRTWTIHDYIKKGIFKAHGQELKYVESAVPDLEIRKFLEVLFDVNRKKAGEMLDSLIEMGFMHVAYMENKMSPKWVQTSPWNRLITTKKQIA